MSAAKRETQPVRMWPQIQAEASRQAAPGWLPQFRLRCPAPATVWGQCQRMALVAKAQVRQELAETRERRLEVSHCSP
jgi:hypothetical protein